MGSAKLLLMAEPSLGLAPIVVNDLAVVIESLNSRGAPVLLIEQGIRLVLRVAQRGHALQMGRVVMDADTAHFKAGLFKNACLGG